MMPIENSPVQHTDAGEPVSNLHLAADAGLTRRGLLRQVATSALALSTLSGLQGGSLLAQRANAAAPANPYAPFKMGLQSYSLRHFGVDDALAKTQALGIHYWEAFPGHFDVTDDAAKIADYKAKLKAHDIEMPVYGVVNFDNDEAGARKVFDFARAMSISTLSASATPDVLAMLDKLCQEYSINLAIHNHGPGNRYDTWESVQKAIAPFSPRIGACIDTGHYLRAKSSPVTAQHEFGKRTYDVHLKNARVNDKGEIVFTEVGVTGGLLDTIALLRNLKNQPYTGIIALEYEEHEDDPLPYIKQCLDATQRYAATIRGVRL